MAAGHRFRTSAHKANVGELNFETLGLGKANNLVLTYSWANLVDALRLIVEKPRNEWEFGKGEVGRWKMLF